MTAASVSVVMATYNGAKFLEPQLASIAGQTRLPDELVVCDDQSSDESVEILERFASRAPFHVRVVRNPERLGCAGNFLRSNLSSIRISVAPMRRTSSLSGGAE